jgi:hypothetical protein
MTLYVVDGDEERWYDDPDEILPVLVEAGVLEVARAWEDVDNGGLGQVRYVSPWTSVEPGDARTGNLEGSE